MMVGVTSVTPDTLVDIMLRTFVPTTKRGATRLVVFALTVAGTQPLAALDAAWEAAPASWRASAVAEQATQADETTEAETSLETLTVPQAATEPSVGDEKQDSAEGMSVVAELSNTRTQDFGLVGVTWQQGSADADLIVQVRTRTGDAWTAWEDLDVEKDQKAEGEDIRGGTSPVWVGESDAVGVRLLSAHEAPEDIEVVLVDGGTGLAQPAEFERSAVPVLARMTTESDSAVATVAAAETTETADSVVADDATVMPAAANGVAPKPVILSRKQWGVDARYESPCDSPLTASAAKGIVLHHTAGANGYTKEQAPGIVRGIHLYHTKSLGWCDIGYNFLVDAYGTIYAGRRGGQEKQVRGAHAGNWDANLYMTGISMMGNYDTAPLTQPLKDSVVKLSAWRLSYFGLNALGKTTIGGKQIPIISGHRDIYTSGIRPATATACPGKYGYEWLNGGMRDAVQARIDSAPVEDDLPEEELPDGPVEEEPQPVLSRLAGDSRYATAAAISKESFPNTGGTVFLASGETFPDALSGGPAAGTQAGPILLSRQKGLPQETIAELQRLAPHKIYILGGEAALSADVAAQASRYAAQVTRLAGDDRYETGVAISRLLWASASTVYVASGTSYPDALSGGALAAHDSAPILLSSKRDLPDAVKSELLRLKPSRVVLLGGTAALARPVRRAIAATLPGAATERLSGANRYATSAAITRAGWSEAEVGYFAAGTDFPDALAGVAAAALDGAPLLLTMEDCLPLTVANAADGLGPIDRVLLGGAAVLHDGASTERCG
jgi:hypothetical protein